MVSVGGPYKLTKNKKFISFHVKHIYVKIV